MSLLAVLLGCKYGTFATKVFVSAFVDVCACLFRFNNLYKKFPTAM